MHLLPSLVHLTSFLYANVCNAAMSPKQVSDQLELDRIAKNHNWKVEPSCATTGEGIFEGLAWLSNNVKVPAK